MSTLTWSQWGIVEESDVKEDERTVGLQETYNSLLEKTGESTIVAKSAIKKMKRVEYFIKVFWCDIRRLSVKLRC